MGEDSRIVINVLLIAHDTIPLIKVIYFLPSIPLFLICCCMLICILSLYLPIGLSSLAKTLRIVILCCSNKKYMAFKVLSLSKVHILD
jgi:hypothetical protein